MAKHSISWSEEMERRVEDARDALKDRDPLDSKPSRSQVVQQALELWLEENGHLLEGDDMGNGLLAKVAG